MGDLIGHGSFFGSGMLAHGRLFFHGLLWSSRCKSCGVSRKYPDYGSYDSVIATRSGNEICSNAGFVDKCQARLAFGKIDVDTAIHRTDIILTGMQMQDLVQEDLKRLLEYIDQVEEEFAEASKNLDGVEREIAGLSGQLSPEQEIRVRRTVDSNNQHIAKAEKVRDKLIRQLDKFSKRVRRTYILSREGFDAAMEAYSKIGAEGDRGRERYHRILDRTRALAERLNPGPAETTPAAPD